MSSGDIIGNVDAFTIGVIVKGIIYCTRSFVCMLCSVVLFSVKYNAVIYCLYRSHDDTIYIYMFAYSLT